MTGKAEGLGRKRPEVDGHLVEGRLGFLGCLNGHGKLKFSIPPAQ